MLGTLILPSSSSLPIFSDETNYFQSQLEPVHKYSLEKIDKNIFNQALNEREELGEKLSNEINKWIVSAMAEDKPLLISSSVSNNRMIPRLQSRGKRRVIHYNRKRTAIHLPRIRTAIEEIGHRWRTARRIVRKGLMSKILRTKQNLKPVSYNNLLRQAEDLSKAKRLTEDEKNALIEIKHINRRANVFIFLNRKRTHLKTLKNGKFVLDWTPPVSGSTSKTMLQEIRFISVDVDGKDLRRTFTNLSDDQILYLINSRIDDLPLKPDIMISSGSGLSFHFHWSIMVEQLSQQCSEYDKQRINTAKSIQKFLSKLLLGDDAAIGINRMWRCPGSFNLKKTNAGPRLCHYVDSSRTFQEAFINPRYTLNQLAQAYLFDFKHESDKQPRNQFVSHHRAKFYDVDYFDSGWESKFDELFPEGAIEGLSEIEIHNLKVIFRHIHQLRHRPDSICFPKGGVLKQIRGRGRPYPPFHRAIELLNQLASQTILYQSKEHKWCSIPSKSMATEYALTEFSRSFFKSCPRKLPDPIDVLETLYLKGQRHDGLYKDAITLFRCGLSNEAIIKSLKDKNKMSAEASDGCEYDEDDLLKQVERAKFFVKRQKSS